MASIYVTFSGETAGSSYDVEIQTQSGIAVGSGNVKAEGGNVDYNPDGHGSNFVAVANRRSSDTFYYPSSSKVNISL